MPEGEQIELLNAHPRIGAAPATVSPTSYVEQGYDRDPGTAALQVRLDELNDKYEGRFGFRFVVFVNDRSRAETADVMEDHMDADRTAEKMRALRDVILIARSRANSSHGARQSWPRVPLEPSGWRRVNSSVSLPRPPPCALRRGKWPRLPPT